MLRVAGCAAVLGGLGWMMVPGDFERTVDRPPAEVAAAIADLDIRDAPGSPGTDPSASGGSLPLFTVESAPDHVSYIVTAHGQVATRMTAWLEPVDGGTRTRVTTSVERGPAPDDYVSPAFRSKGVTLALFSTLLEDQLDQLVFKVGPWGPHCDAVMERFEARNIANGGLHQPSGLTDAVAGTAKAAMSISMLDKELKAAGCPANANANSDAPRDRDGFAAIRSDMGSGPSAPVYDDSGHDAAPPSPKAATTPATDLSKYR